MHLDFITGIVNKTFRDGEFPNMLKYVEILTFYKNNCLHKEDYRAVTVLSHKFKICDRQMHERI